MKKTEFFVVNRGMGDAAEQRSWNLVVASVILLISLQSVSGNTVSIVSGFEKQTVEEGGNFTLQCRATGLYHVTITWLLDGLPLEYKTPEPTGSVRLKADNPHSNSGLRSREDKSRFSIKNSNEMGIDASTVVEENMTEETTPKRNESDESTQAVSVVEKRTTTVKTIISPISNRIYDIPRPIVPPNIVFSEDGEVTVTSVLSLDHATVSDGGVYTCVARDVIREASTWSKKIAVAGPLSVRQNRPIFALFDSLVIIPCTVLGTGEELPVKWYYQKFPNADEILYTESQWIALPNDHRQTVHPNGSFAIRDARKNNEGVYLCQVDLGERVTNMSTPLKVMVPPKIKPFVLPPVQVGNPVADFCMVLEGDFPLDVSWYRNGLLLRPNEHTEVHRSGKRALSFSISSVTLESAGNYSCCAENNVSRACVVSELVVLDPPKIPNLPTQVAAISGNDVSIPCRATGFPKPNVTWMRVVDDSRSDYATIEMLKSNTSPANKAHKIAQTPNGSLVIENVSSADAGKYLCHAVNKVGDLSRFVTLQVHNPARITELIGTQDVIYQSNVTIECASWGDDVVEVKWLKNGLILPASGRFVLTKILNYRTIDSLHPVTLNRITILRSRRTDAGLYFCEASNKYGASTRNIDILVRAPPSNPSKFEVIDKGTSFLRMVVSPGEDDGGSKLLSYELTYVKIYEELSPQPPEYERKMPTLQTREKQEITTIKYPASAANSDQDVVLDRLECGAEYEMSVRSVNEIGESFEALDLTARTIGTVPIIPEVNELVVDVNQSAVVLDLRAWQNGGCAITEISIEYARHGDTEWNITLIDSTTLEKALSHQAENAGSGAKNPGHLVISDLQGGTWYKFWTSSCNNVGCNYVTHSLATLLPGGATVPPLKTKVEKKATGNNDARFLVPMVCGFGLVLLLVLLLLFYRHKQRSKKQLRLKEARKMANTLLYKTDDGPPSAQQSLPDNDSEDSSGVAILIRTSFSSANEDEASIQATSENNTVTVPYLEDGVQENTDTMANLPTKKPGPPSAPGTSINNESMGSKRSDGKKSLKDNEELAVFRDPVSSDDEDHATSLLVCDESAFGDSGTWSYFQPGSKSRRPKKYVAVPTADRNPTQRRRSSTSSGTDEELAQVFGLTSSKRKFKPVTEKEDAKSIISDVNDNYRPTSNRAHQKHIPSPSIMCGGVIDPKKTDHYFAVGDHQERANSTGMVQKVDPRICKPLPEDANHRSRRHNFPIQHRPVVSDRNPFKTAFHAPHHVPLNFHRPNVQTRGHTYSHDVAPNWADTPTNINNLPADCARFGNIVNSSPYAERQWVDTYDSRYGSTRSKPPSWGSTELDKQGFYTPPSSNVSAFQRDASPKYRSTESATDHNDRTYPCVKDNRKLESNSPRDSGIGSDEGPASRHLSSSVSPSHIKGRNNQKSLESLDEVESHKGDRSSSCSSSHGDKAPPVGGKDYIFPMSPPPSPPTNETRLAPHIFVDISSKCNTTPTRTARSSYPPSGQVPTMNYYHLAPPRKLGDYLPTPPPSGPTSPEESAPPRSHRRRGNGGWCTADLDGLGKYKYHKSDSRLTGESDVPEHKAAHSRNSDTTYSMTNDDNTWQASTLV